MSFYNKHIFFCTNQKSENKQCCANHNAAEMVAYAKQRSAELGVNKESKVRINGSGCMGRCELGPVIAVYPQGTWYTYKNTHDIDAILEATLSDEICTANIITDPL